MTVSSAQKTHKNTSKPRKILSTAFKVVLVLALLIAVPIVNITVDPSGIFNTGRDSAPEIKAAQIMLAGSNVTGLKSSFNDRLLRREYIAGMAQSADVVVSGSSRSEPITAEMAGLDDGTFMNISVSGCELWDTIGLLGLMSERGMLPKTLVISLEPWMINDAYSLGRYKGKVSDGVYYYLTEHMGRTADESLLELDALCDAQSTDGGFFSLPAETQREALSIAYFQGSLKYVARGDWAKYHTAYATELDEGDTAIMRADGSYCYPAEYRSADTETVTERAREAVKEGVLGLEKLSDSFYGEGYALLCELLAALANDGVEVKLLMLPYSPEAYENSSAASTGGDRTEAFAEAERIFTELADEFGLDIVGSFNPDTFGYDMSAFYDAYHIREEYIAPITRALFADEDRGGAA